MEFNEKLQELRRQKGLTQEDLAAALFVSRTAVSKWESGRGYPNIDSLRQIANFFSVSIDDLLSGDELLCLAQADTQRKANHARDLVFGLLDMGAAALLFLPLFGQNLGGGVISVSLLGLSGVSPYLLGGFFAVVIGLILWGVLTLTLQNLSHPLWQKCKGTVSVLLSVFGSVLFIISRQPYAATLLFLFLAIKAIIITKK